MALFQNIIRIEGASYWQANAQGGLTNTGPFPNPARYEEEVQRILSRIGQRASGRALFSLIQSTGKVVLVMPVARPQEASAVPLRGTDAVLPATLPGAGASGSSDAPADAFQPGRGTESAIAFSTEVVNPYRQRASELPPGRQPGEILFHELIHSVQQLRGTVSWVAQHDLYERESEFFAVVATNVYISEGGGRVLRASHHFLPRGEEVIVDRPAPAGRVHGTAGEPPEPASIRFVRQYEQLLRRLHHTDEALFNALAAVPAHFNPFRDFGVVRQARGAASHTTTGTVCRRPQYSNLPVRTNPWLRF